MVCDTRQGLGRDARTTFLIVDAQSVRNTDTAEEKGYLITHFAQPQRPWPNPHGTAVSPAMMLPKMPLPWADGPEFDGGTGHLPVIARHSWRQDVDFTQNIRR